MFTKHLLGRFINGSDFYLLPPSWNINHWEFGRITYNSMTGDYRSLFPIPDLLSQSNLISSTVFSPEIELRFCELMRISYLLSDVAAFFYIGLDGIDLPDSGFINNFINDDVLPKIFKQVDDLLKGIDQ